jgi:toxin FitB
MIIIDTNVISELARFPADPRVLAWAGSIETTQFWTTAITEAEIKYGLARLPAGRRRDDLTQASMHVLNVILSGRILPFDRRATDAYGAFLAQRVRDGRTIDIADAMIAAIARANGASLLATRNLHHFHGCGVPLFDPWSA